MRQIRPFVILFQGRTGSSYLNSTLRSHPDISARGEELVDQLRHNRLKKVRDVLTGESASGRRTTGLKTKFADIGDPEAFSDLLRNIHANIVYLGRRNRVKHAVSFFTGMRLFETTGHWNLHKGVEHNDNAIKIDVSEFDKKLREIEKQNAALQQYVMELELPTLCLYYEDLIRFKKPFIDTVLQFLNVPVLPLKGRIRKNTSDDLRNVLANFDELKAFYAESTYFHMFDEVLTDAG